MIPLIFAAAVTAASTAASGTNPHAQQQVNFFRPPPDTSEPEAGLPAGTIQVEIRDALNNVVPNRSVDLGIIQQSIAKGENRKHVSQTTGADGITTFTGLEHGSGFAYRVTSHAEDATFAARPFNLAEQGMRIVLHVYDVVHELPATLQIGAHTTVVIEVKDDRIQFQERIDLFNGTPSAWVPHDLIMRLPSSFTALTSQQQMSDLGVDAVPGQGARLHGTFLPGNNSITFNWQLPYSNEPNIDFEMAMPPAAREVVVAADAAPGMKLAVGGFRDAASRKNEDGQRFLVAGKQLNDTEQPIRNVHITLSDLPTPGPTRLVGTVLAIAGIVAGIWLATQQRARSSTKSTATRNRERILDEVTDLEHAHARGDVGPKTYERARRELVDELASLLATSK